MASSRLFDLVIFDLDGTLIDSVGEIAGATNAVLVQQGFTAATTGQVRDWVGYGARETVVRALAHASGRSRDALRAAKAEVDAAMVEFSAAYQVADDSAAQVFPGVVDTLEALQVAGVKLALATNKEQALTTRVLPLCGLDHFFEPTLAGDSLPRRKPDPLPVEHCLAYHQVSAERTLFVGDSPVDVATARAAGVECWALSWGYSGGRPIADSRPDRVMNAFTELLEVIQIPG